MPQDRVSGAEGRIYGLRMGRALSMLLDARMIKAGSNEARWHNKTIVIKSCAPANTSFGVTTAMLSRLDAILVACERQDGSVAVFELDPDRFRQSMRDSLSSGPSGRVKLVRKRVAETDGKRIALFSAAQMSEAISKVESA